MKFKIIIRQIGIKRLFRLPFYLLTQIIFNPIRLSQALYDLAIILYNGSWREYSRYNVYRSLNSSFHRNYDLIMEKYGQQGYAFSISMGWPLSPMIQLTKISMWLYRRFEIIIPVLGCLLFVAALNVFALNTEIDFFYLLSAIGLVLFSSYFYYGAFESLKYDALGWALTPLVFYGLFYDQFALCSLSLLLISFCSISVLVPILILTSVCLIYTGIQDSWVIIPAALKFLYHFKFILKNLKDLIITTNALGMGGKGKKAYQLKIQPEHFGFIFLDTLFITSVIWFDFESPIPKYGLITIAFVVELLYITNICFARFADDQTMYMLKLVMFSIITFHCKSWFHLIFFYVAISPIPLMLSFAGVPSFSYFDVLPRLKPFKISSLENAVSDFLYVVPNYGRILFVFDFWKKSYPDFDGYAPIRELLQYVACDREILIFPDFYTYFDSFSNKINLEKILKDNSPESCLNAAQTIGARHFILCADNAELDSFWLKNGFKKLAHLDLGNFISSKEAGADCYPKDKPFLLLTTNDICSEYKMILNGELVDIRPNQMTINISNLQYPTIIKLIFDKGWKVENDDNCIIERDLEFGWLLIKNASNSRLILKYS